MREMTDGTKNVIVKLIQSSNAGKLRFEGMPISQFIVDDVLPVFLPPDYSLNGKKSIEFYDCSLNVSQYNHERDAQRRLYAINFKHCNIVSAHFELITRFQALNLTFDKCIIAREEGLLSSLFRACACIETFRFDFRHLSLMRCVEIRNCVRNIINLVMVRNRKTNLIFDSRDLGYHTNTFFVEAFLNQYIGNDALQYEIIDCNASYRWVAVKKASNRILTIRNTFNLYEDVPSEN